MPRRHHVRHVVLCVLCVLCVLRTAGDGAQSTVTLREITLTLTEGTSMSAAMSPDRQWIAFDLVGRLWIMPARGGEAQALTPLLLEARQPTWSPDSRSIAFQGYDDGVWHIYVVGRDGGEPRALTSGEFDDREPAWSHHGSRIAFSSDRFGGIVTCWEVDAATGAVRQLSKRDAWMPAWSPNDREITVVSLDHVNRSGEPVAEANQRPGLWGIDEAGRERPLVGAERGPMPTGASWNADGTEIAYTAGSRLHVGSDVLSRGEDVFPFRPQWISETDILYTADGHIKRRSIGQAPAIVPFTATVTLQRPTYTTARRRLEPQGAQPVRGIVGPVVAPDGRSIAFTALGDLWVKRIAPGSADAIQITDDGSVELDPVWSPDGRQLAYASDRSGHMNLWIHDFGTGTDSRITDEARAAVTDLAWSPDGSHIAFLLDHHDFAAVRVRPGNGMGGREVGSAPRELGRPTWAPDSRSIAMGRLLPYSDRYREGLNQLMVHSFEFGSDATSILRPGHSAGNRDAGGPVWSPNGLQMAFVSEGALWVVPVDTRGAPTAPPFVVAEDQPESPSWEGDSRHIVYQTPAGLRRVLADGGPAERIAVDLKWIPSVPPPRVVVHAGRLIDGIFDGLRGDVDIVVERGIIRDLSGHRDELHRGATVVDAAGEVVMPGLIEMHAHLSADYGERFGRVWLAYGITSVRMPAVNPYAAIEQRESFESGRRPGPRLFIAGDPFDGVRIYYPGGVAVTSDAQLERELERASALDIDFYKTYVRLPDRLQKRVVEFAHALGKPVTSHELYPAVAFGVDGVEHLRGTSRRGYSPKASATNRAYKDVIDLIARSGMTLTPTIGIQGGFAAQMTGDKSLLFDQRLSLFPLAVVSRLTDLASADPNPALDDRIKAYEETLKAIAAAGGRIIAGTDAPIDPYGLGLHAELAAYVHAGLTPFQALQTATANAAQALGLQDDLGTIEPGKLADLTFLTSNPLEDIHNTRDVVRVMKGGRVYTVQEMVRRP